MAEFLDRDVLQHVPDAGILDVEGLHPILQRGCQLAGCTSELLEQERPESCIRLTNVNGFDELFAMKEHGRSPG